jgi:hypothetical protein
LSAHSSGKAADSTSPPAASLRRSPLRRLPAGRQTKGSNGVESVLIDRRSPVSLLK